MSASFEVQVETHFDAEHCLDLAGGRCEAHEHRWRVAVRARSPRLDHIAIVVDFRKLRQQADELVARLAGKNLEETDELREGDTGPGGVAEWLLDELRRMNVDEDYVISSVTVGCDPRIDVTVGD